MKKFLVAAAYVLVSSATSAQAMEISQQEAVKIVGQGEIFWTHDSRPEFLVRQSGQVYFCTTTVSRITRLPELEEIDTEQFPQAAVDHLRDNPSTAAAAAFDEVFGEGSSLTVIGNSYDQKYTRLTCYDSDR